MYVIYMKIAILVSGALNTAEQLKEKGYKTVTDIVYEYCQNNHDFDTFICTTNQGAFKYYDSTALKDGYIYDYKVISKDSYGKYDYTIGYLNDKDITDKIHKVYKNVKGINIIDDNCIPNHININSESQYELFNKYKFFYLYSYKVLQAIDLCHKYEINNSIQYDLYISIRPDSYIVGDYTKAYKHITEIFKQLLKTKELCISAYIQNNNIVKNTHRGSVSEKVVICTQQSVHIMKLFFNNIHKLKFQVYNCKKCPRLLYEDDYDDKLVNKCYVCGFEKLINQTDYLIEYKLRQHFFVNNVNIINLGIKFLNLR